MAGLESRAAGWVTLLLPLLLAGGPARAEEPLTADPEVGGARLWDDGKAEVARYRVQREIYGEVREGEAVLLTVKEPFDPVRLVKQDSGGPPSVDVLKMHRVETLPTPYYPYRYAVTAFAPREDPLRVLKLVVTSQEWCGTTYQAWRRKGEDGAGELEWRSYFGEEGDGTAATPGGALPLLVADALPLSLRALPFADGYRARARLLGSRHSNHAGPPRIEEVALTVSDGGSRRVGDAEMPVWAVTLTGPGGTWRLWFAQALPHVMVEARTPDGIRTTLVQVERRAYWPGGDPPPPADR